MELDFTHAKINPLKMYGGKNGSKIGIIYQDVTYMLKFPPKANKNPDISYTNSCISEYVACHIFQSLGIPTQETFLGRYKDKVVVACRDFEVDGFYFKEFAHLKNTLVDSENSGYGTELQDIMQTISQQQLVPPADLERFFWEMFVADALLGNFDRHNGNWGFLVNQESGIVKMAPIFDCGSCLYPQMDEARMRRALDEPKERDERIFAYPNSAIKHGNVKLSYARFLMETDNSICLSAIQDIGTRIHMTAIHEIVDTTPFISDVNKRFLKTMLQERKEKIIDRALKRIQAKDKPRPRDHDAR